MRAMRILIGAAGFCLAGLAPACADAIDGNWCSPDGARQLTIDGPKLTTPGGQRIEGSYTRHTFDYVAPAREVEAGKRIEMRLRGEYAVLFRPEGAPEAQTWRRCARPIS